jgi:hypothetical protein
MNTLQRWMAAYAFGFVCVTALANEPPAVLSQGGLISFVHLISEAARAGLEFNRPTNQRINKIDNARRLRP